MLHCAQVIYAILLTICALGSTVLPESTDGNQQANEETPLFVYGSDAAQDGGCAGTCLRFSFAGIPMTDVNTVMFYLYDHGDLRFYGASNKTCLVYSSGKLMLSVQLAEDSKPKQWIVMNALEPFKEWVKTEVDEVTLDIRVIPDLNSTRFHYSPDIRPFFLLDSLRGGPGSSRSAENQHHRITQQRTKRATGCSSAPNSTRTCSLHNYTVNLNCLGEQFSWILEPRIFIIQYCAGTCRDPVLRAPWAKYLLRDPRTYEYHCHAKNTRSLNFTYQTANKAVDVGQLGEITALNCTCS